MGAVSSAQNSNLRERLAASEQQLLTMERELLKKEQELLRKDQNLLHLVVQGEEGNQSALVAHPDTSHGQASRNEDPSVIACSPTPCVLDEGCTRTREIQEFDLAPGENVWRIEDEYADRWDVLTDSRDFVRLLTNHLLTFHYSLASLRVNDCAS